MRRDAPKAKRKPMQNILVRTCVWAALTGVASFGLASAAAAADKPFDLKLGIGPGSDLPMHLINLVPEITTYRGKTYNVQLEHFRGTDMRFRAFLADAIHGATGSGNSVLVAASRGLDFKIVASVSKESKKGFNTQFRVLKDSPIKSKKDLKGKVIGINALKSSIHLWARVAVEKAGLDPDRDVTFTLVNFPVQGEALRQGRIDVAAIIQPYAVFEDAKGDTRVLFTSKDAMPFDEELQLVLFRPDVLKSHPQAVRGFLADFAAATRFYLEKPVLARKALLANKIVRKPEDV
jgi:ABC-type nitrate/sulfonate/bicarbonate transport system substrate-binding protein